MEKVISVETMRQSDAYTIENFIDSKSLMYKAGVGVFESCDWQGRVAIVCGSGNNAGDGYVLALLLKEINVPVTLFLIKDKFSQDGRYYFDKCMKAEIPYCLCEENTSFEDYNMVVDCIFGTGFKGKARGLSGEIIDKINEFNGTVISVDINSGLNGDNGMSEKCVKSHTTVSIGYLKPGLLINDAPKYIGELKNCDIGIELVGEYFILQDSTPDISAKENTFENLKDFSDCYEIPYETACEKPVEVILSVAKEKKIPVLVKNLGEYSVIISENTAYIVRG
ncbi:MAG: NAD(P)H-hydrate epimerase [Ruminococcus sp.]